MHSAEASSAESPLPAWSALPADAKRERLLAAASAVFAEHGFEAPMPLVARVAGASVGSLYRQFASKEELLAALAERRLTTLHEELVAALDEPSAWEALQAFVWHVLGDDATADVAARAVAEAGASPAVQLARERLWAVLERLVARAQEQGDARADATRADIAMLIVGARAVRRLGPDTWRRLVDVGFDGLRAR